MVVFLISATFWGAVLTRGRRLLQGGAYSNLSGKIAAPIKLVLRDKILYHSNSYLLLFKKRKLLSLEIWLKSSSDFEVSASFQWAPHLEDSKLSIRGAY